MSTHLTPLEFDILRVLALHAGKLVTHRQLLREVWGPEYLDETHYLRVHIAHIRSKLEPDASSPRYVVTDLGSATGCASLLDEISTRAPGNLTRA